MATRPVFRVKSLPPHYESIDVEFQFFSGFAASQQRKSVESLHEAYLSRFPDSKVLEISTRSEVMLGQMLSAFNLRCDIARSKIPVENIFQSSKVFEHGGPYLDLLEVPPYGIKKDERLRESGKLIRFEFQNEVFPLEPKTFFYDWVYINALVQNPELSKQLMEYDAFTDIAFNPQKSINCQARTAAIYVSLVKSSLLDTALKSPQSFCNTVYEENKEGFEQYSLF